MALEIIRKTNLRQLTKRETNHLFSGIRCQLHSVHNASYRVKGVPGKIRRPDVPPESCFLRPDLIHV